MLRDTMVQLRVDERASANRTWQPKVRVLGDVHRRSRAHGQALRQKSGGNTHARHRQRGVAHNGNGDADMSSALELQRVSGLALAAEQTRVT